MGVRSNTNPEAVGVLLVQHKSAPPVLEGKSTPFWYGFNKRSAYGPENL